MKTAFLIVAVVALFTAPLAGCAAFQNPSHGVRIYTPVSPSGQALYSRVVYEVSGKNIEYRVRVSTKKDNRTISIYINQEPTNLRYLWLVVEDGRIIMLNCSMGSAPQIKKFMSDHVQQHFPPKIRKRIAEAMKLIPTALRPHTVDRMPTLWLRWR